MMEPILKVNHLKKVFHQRDKRGVLAVNPEVEKVQLQNLSRGLWIQQKEKLFLMDRISHI